MYLFVSLDLKPIAVELRADRYASYPAKPELSVTSPESETINSATYLYIYIYVCVCVYVCACVFRCEYLSLGPRALTRCVHVQPLA